MGQDQLFFSVVNILTIIRAKHKNCGSEQGDHLETLEVAEMKNHVVPAL